MIPQNKIDLEKNKIISNCKYCKGIGCNRCFGYCSYIDKLVAANIPVDYWYRSFEKFYGDEKLKNYISDYIKNIKDEYYKGYSLCLIGHRGTGKTMSACAILKQAILQKYECFYITLVDAISKLTSFESHTFRYFLKNIDFLVIDEVDQRFFPTFNSQELYGSHFENIIRPRTHNKLPTIICTNSGNIDEIFQGQFEESFKSLKLQFIKEISILGKDARKSEGKF